MKTIKWISGTGEAHDFPHIVSCIKDHVHNDGKLFVGTDSFITGDECVFATAVCLHGANGQKGGKYFFKRTRKPRKKFSELLVRILKEVQDSIDIALYIAERFPSASLEIHLDIGTGQNNKTSKFVNMLTAYAKSTGFKCKVKPHAWASASVADRHSKKYL